MNLNNQVLAKIEQIHKVLLVRLNLLLENPVTYTLTESYSLYGEMGGIILFMKRYSELKGSETEFENCHKLLSNAYTIYSKALYNTTSSYAFGPIGILWLFGFLYETGYFEDEQDEVLLPFDDYVYTTALDLLKHSNYDPIHGGVGAMRYFVVRSGFHHYLKILIPELLSLLNTNEEGTYVYQNKNLNVGLPSEISQDARIVNLGIAHGIPGIALFLLSCYKKLPGQQLQSTLKSAITGIISFILNNANTDDYSISIYPQYVVEKENNYSRNSRIAWCYGDYSIAYLLYEAGNHLDNDKWKEEAIKIAQHSCLRLNHEQTSVFDAGLCHGTSSGLIFSKYFYNKTKQSVFSHNMNFWARKTLDLGSFSDGLAGYKYWIWNMNDSFKWRNDLTFLTGISGTGLCLLEYLFGDEDIGDWSSALYL